MDARVTKVTKKKNPTKVLLSHFNLLSTTTKKMFYLYLIKKKKKMSINLHSLFLFAWHGERGRRGYR